MLCITLRLRDKNVCMICTQILEGQIHQYLEGGACAMEIDECHMLKDKHCEMVEKLCAFHFPWVQNNRYNPNSVCYRKNVEDLRVATSILLHDYERENFIDDGTDLWEKRNPLEIKHTQVRHNLAVQHRQQMAREKIAKNTLQNDEKKLQEFLEEHEDLMEQDIREESDVPDEAEPEPEDEEKEEEAEEEDDMDDEMLEQVVEDNETQQDETEDVVMESTNEEEEEQDKQDDDEISFMSYDGEEHLFVRECDDLAVEQEEEEEEQEDDDEDMSDK